MGCCNNDNCSRSDKKNKPRVPWFALAVGVLVILVLVNWK
jgi:hypothetical protein